MQTVSKTPKPVSWSRRSFVKSLTTSQPSVRMIVLEVDVWPNDAGRIEHEVRRLPIVALESSIVHHWSRRDRNGEPDRDEYPTERELRESDSGYRFQYQEVRHDVVVVNPDSDDGELVTLTEFRECQSETYRIRLVACDWPQPEDETRLAPIVAEMISKAAACVRSEFQQPIGGRMES